ncbi:MAG: hypothetical protein M3161_02635 [Actinomycetota bacterium]|nr:hypothetical protein [Actinomycetota bacterium]
MKRTAFTAIASGVVVALLFSFAGIYQANADHEPANKVAAAGSTVEVAGPGEKIPVLQERVRVSSPFDLILQLSAECDILTDLTFGGTGGAGSASAFGQVRMWIEIDGIPVPITTKDSGPPNPQQPGDDGKVVFCNRAHERSVTDHEDDDGTDEHKEMTQTRQANAFNWLALDLGFNYDNPANGRNVFDIIVYAEFTETALNRANAEALIGNRTLIAEPTNASVHEWVQQNDPGGT